MKEFNYKEEFQRLLSAVKQFLNDPKSKAVLAVLENAVEYYRQYEKNVGKTG